MNETNHHEDKGSSVTDVKTTRTMLLAFLLLVVPRAAYAQNIQDFGWQTNADNSITITSYDGPLGSVAIPPAINDMAVTGIADFAFELDTNIATVTIPASVVNIGETPFADCGSLSNITVVPANPAYASSSGVLFNKGFTALLEFPENSAVSSFSIPIGVTSVSAYAFSDCANLTSVIIPSSVTNIGETCFSGCTLLTNITLPTGAIGIGVGAFEATGLENVAIPTGYTTIGPYCYAYCLSLTNVTIPNGVTNIGDGAFFDTVLTSISIPASVTSIGNQSFGQSALSTVALSASVTNIGNEAFASCYSLAAIQVDANNPSYASVDGVLFNKSQTILIQYPTGNGATSYVIPNGVDSIGDEAFGGDETVTNVTIPGSVTNIGDGSFGATGLTSATIPGSVVSISSYAFAYSYSLAQVYFLGNAPVADSTIFYHDDGSVYYESGTSGWGTDFGGLTPKVLTPWLYVTNSGAITITGYSGPGGNVAIPGSINGLPVAAIGMGAFAGNSVITSITIPNSVISIAAGAWFPFDYPGAFADCASLTNVIIGSGLTKIPELAFDSCAALAQIVIPSNVTVIGSGAFYYSGLTNLVIPNTVMSIGGGGTPTYPGAFDGCASLAEVTISTNITQIGDEVFSGCGMTSVVIPKGVTSIGDAAFAFCLNLANVAIPNSVATIGDGIVGYGAFQGCPSLAAITLPASVAYLGEFAFAECYNLRSIYFLGSAPGWIDSGDDQFVGDTNTIGYYLPGTSGWGSEIYAQGGIPTVPWMAGSLQVIVAPAAAAAAGAQWQVDNGAWQTSGAIVTGLTAGSHTVNFRSVPGWSTPLSQTVSVASNTFADSIATYLGGSLQVTIGPSGAVTAGAAWTLDGGGSYNSGMTLNNLPIGNHVVSYTYAPGWAAPSPQTVAITNEVTSATNGVYTQLGPPDTNFEYSVNPDNTITLTTYIGGSSAVNIPATINGRTVTAIGNNQGFVVFYLVNLTSVSIPNTVTSIGVSAFDNRTGLTNLIIPDSVKTIADSAFVFCSGLQSVTLGNGLTNLGGAFTECTGLTNITVPGSVISLDGTFVNCTGLRTAIVEEGMVDIGPDAFNGCSSLTNISIPPSVTTLGEDSFAGCDSLADFVIPDSITNLGEGVFFVCNGLTNVVIGNGVGNIGEATFEDCPELASVEIGNGVTNIDSEAFNGCAALGTLSLPDTVESIGYACFGGCSSLTNIIIGTGLTALRSDAFYLCSNLTALYFEGNAPAADLSVFAGAANAIAFYQSGTTGWSTTFEGIPAILFAPNSACVTLQPDSALVDGAQWQVDGGTWQNNGAMVSNLSPGAHLIGFKAAPGFSTPSTQTIAVSSSAVTRAIGTYAAQAGSLEVTITPEAIEQGAEWILDGANEGFATVVNNVPVGAHAVSFTSIAGWTTPPSQTVTVSNETLTQVVGEYVPDSQAGDLTLVTNGYGIIRRGAGVNNPVSGRRYTVTAAPKARNVFSEWIASGSQSFVSDKASLIFTMSSGLILQANFVTNVFLAAQGVYRGLFAPTDVARQQLNSGSFLISVTTSGTFSGSLDLGGQILPVSGKFNLDGTAESVSKRPQGQSSLTTILQLDFADQSVSGSVSDKDSTFTAQLNGDRDVFSSLNKATEVEGQYTLVIPGTNETTVGPYGVSYGTVKVGPLGTVTLAGSLADGTAVSQSSVVSKDGNWPLYLNLYGGKGSLWGWSYFSNHTLTAPLALSWINGTNSARTALYRSGFTNQQAILVGGLYLPSQTLPADLTATLQGGDLASAITIPDLSENVNKLTLHTNKTTGLITGSFANPDEPRKIIKVNGVILQSQTNAQGYFLGLHQSGAFFLGAQ